MKEIKKRVAVSGRSLSKQMASLSDDIWAVLLEIKSAIRGLGELTTVNKKNIFAMAKHYTTQPLSVYKLDETLPDLAYANKGDSGLDIYAPVDFKLEPGEEAKIPLGYKLQIPSGFEVQARPRSGSNGFTILNAPGTIDSGYRGEIKCKIRNYTNETIEFKKGISGLCQLVLCPIIRADISYLSESEFETNTERGEKGFGSTPPPEK